MTSARVRALVGACALVAASGAWAGPGAAPASASVCSLTIDSPAPNAVFDVSTVRFTGSLVVTGEATPSVEVSFLDGPSPPPPPPPQEVGGTGGYDVPVQLSHNGTYTARVVATHDASSETGCDGGPGQPSMDGTVTFGVNAPARPPVNVRSRFEAVPRTAVVTWERSPDPDTRYYLIRRFGPGGSALIGRVAGDVLSWTDTSPPAGAATVTYGVSSVRNGTDQSALPVSAWVEAAPLNVPAPPAPPPPPGPVGQPAAGGQTTGTPAAGRPTSASTPLTSVTPATPGGRAAPRAGVADPGTLVDPEGTQGGAGDPPFTLPPWADGEEGQVQLVDEGGDEPAVGGGGGTGRRGVPALAYVAAGLLSAVVAAHFLWLRKQALQPDEEAPEDGLPVEAVGLASAVGEERPASPPPSVLESLGEAPAVALPEAAPSTPWADEGERQASPEPSLTVTEPPEEAPEVAPPVEAEEVPRPDQADGWSASGDEGEPALPEPVPLAAAWSREAPEVPVSVEGPEVAPAAEVPEVAPVAELPEVDLPADAVDHGAPPGEGSSQVWWEPLPSEVAVPVEAPEVDLPSEAVGAPASSDEVAPPTEPEPAAVAPVESGEVPEPAPAAPLADEGPPEPPAPMPHPVIVLRPLPRVRPEPAGPRPNDHAEVEALV